MSRWAVVATVVVLLGAGTKSRGQWEEPARAGKWMVASGHELASEAGRDILRQGGNAFDAAVATLMALNVTRPVSAGMVGVAPTLIYDARDGRVRSYNGLGVAPGQATPGRLRAQGWLFMPAVGINAQLIPASPDVWIAILEEYGTMSFGQVAAAAIGLAEDGHPLNRTCVNTLKFPGYQLFLMKRLWPYNYSILWQPFEPDGPQVGDVLVQKDLARTLRLMAAAEEAELKNSGDRGKALQAARSVFYQGEIAEAIVRNSDQHGGLIARADLAGFRGRFDDPAHGTYKGYTVWANPFWNQGPTVPMILQILQNVDLKSLGHNTPEYLSAVAQAVELAFADREAYFGDPDFVDVPMKGLLSREYAAERARLIDPGRAFGRMPPPGDPWKYEGRARPDRVYRPRPIPASLPPLPFRRDTTYLCVVDGQGNALSITPSDFPASPMVEGYGILLGNRMNQFRLKNGHPDQVQPGKRPRLTPNPSLVTRDGKLFMVFGTPGGDQQPQAMVQVFLNIIEWGMDPQAAINAPRIKSANFPDSFSPHLYFPGRLALEQALADRAPALKQQGYDVRVLPPPAVTMGAVCAIIKQPDGTLIGGADPREEAVALGD